MSLFDLVRRGVPSSPDAMSADGSVPESPPSLTEESVLDALSEVIDPELGINIVDLGLVYGIGINDNRVQVTMTMTTPACPLGAHLTDMIEVTLWKTFPEMKSADVQIVFDPLWEPSMISDAARHQLGLE